MRSEKRGKGRRTERRSIHSIGSILLILGNGGVESQGTYSLFKWAERVAKLSLRQKGFKGNCIRKCENTTKKTGCGIAKL